MTDEQSDEDRPARLDEQDLLALLDRESPGLLAVARAAGADRDTAQRLVEAAWTSAVRAGRLVPGGMPARVVLVRQMAAGPGTAGVRRELRTALAGARTHAVPRQRTEASTSASPPLPGGAPVAAHLRRVPPPLRLVLVLRDVAGWSAADVQALLDVHPAAQRAMLGQARRALLESLRVATA